MKLRSSVQITLIIVVGIILLTLISIFTIKSFVSSSKDSLQVNGQSTIKVTPDLITLSYNVETKGNTSKEAEDSNTDIVNDLIYRVIQLGFDKTDLKTENFNIYPEYD
ncbi:MAG: SIMPL domain-containing protein, partial [Nanoarchaeota archaeon]